MKGARSSRSLRRSPSRARLRWGGAILVGIVAIVAIGGAMLAQGSGNQPSAVSFLITSPASEATVSSPVPLGVKLRGAQLGSPTDGLDHLHIAVDGGQTVAIYESPVPSLRLPPGRHTLMVELAGPDHRALTATQPVTFVVRP